MKKQGIFIEGKYENGIFFARDGEIPPATISDLAERGYEISQRGVFDPAGYTNAREFNLAEFATELFIAVAPAVAQAAWQIWQGRNKNGK